MVSESELVDWIFRQTINKGVERWGISPRPRVIPFIYVLTYVSSRRSQKVVIYRDKRSGRYFTAKRGEARTKEFQAMLDAGVIEKAMERSEFRMIEVHFESKVIDDEYHIERLKRTLPIVVKKLLYSLPAYPNPEDNYGFIYETNWYGSTLLHRALEGISRPFDPGTIQIPSPEETENLDINDEPFEGWKFFHRYARPSDFRTYAIFEVYDYNYPDFETLERTGRFVPSLRLRLPPIGTYVLVPLEWWNFHESEEMSAEIFYFWLLRRYLFRLPRDIYAVMRGTIASFWGKVLSEITEVI